MNKLKCRICKSDHEYQTIRANNVYGTTEKYKFYQCSVCDLVYLHPPIDKKLEKKIYQEEFESFMSKRSNTNAWHSDLELKKANKENIDRRNKVIKPYLNNAKNVLEIGCSSGFMLDQINKNEVSCFGIEPSNKFSHLLKQKGYKLFDNLTKIKNTSFKFDLIMSFFVMEHIDNSKKFIDDQLILLNKNGKIIIEIPCVQDPLTSLYKIPKFENFYWSIVHHYYFSIKSISFLLDKINCKYSIIKDQRYDLSNHITWLEKGKPGGQNFYKNIFSKKTINSYKKDLIKVDKFDTMFLIIGKN